MDLIEQLTRDEDDKEFPYVDSVGKITIGIGHNLTDRGLSKAARQFILAEDIAEVKSQLSPFAWYQNLDSVRQGAIENMVFNMGIGDLLHFPSMIHYLTIHDYVNAKAEALNSKWAKQVGDRATRIARQLETGEWQ
jgi:lysozyme